MTEARPSFEGDGVTDSARETREAAIARERLTRHWTIPQWKEAAAAEGREDWPKYSAEVQVAADGAVDSLIKARRYWRDRALELQEQILRANG